MSARRIFGLGATVLALALPTASASAATIYAGPLPTSYLNADIDVRAGEPITFFNLDFTAPHDVTSLDINDQAAPLFRSDTVSAPAEVPVVGAENLTAGRYEYLCSIHPNMTGTITVSGGGGGGGDDDAPSLKLKATDSDAGDAAKAGKLRFKVTTDEAAKLSLTATKGKTKVAKASKKVGKGKSNVSAKLTKAGEKLLRKAKSVTLKVKAKATDSAGNAATKTVKVELR